MGTAGTPSPEFQTLIDQATANESVEDAAAALLTSLAAQIVSLASQLAASPTKDQLLALAAAMKTHADALGVAVAAGTPAAPTP